MLRPWLWMWVVLGWGAKVIVVCVCVCVCVCVLNFSAIIGSERRLTNRCVANINAEMLWWGKTLFVQVVIAYFGPAHTSGLDGVRPDAGQQ